VVYIIQPGHFWKKTATSRGHNKEKGKLEFSVSPTRERVRRRGGKGEEEGGRGGRRGEEEEGAGERKEERKDKGEKRERRKETGTVTHTVHNIRTQTQLHDC